METNTEPWFIVERAEMMAVLALTRLPEVIVRRQSEGYGSALLVSVSSQRSARVFGVLVKGATKSTSCVTPQGLVRSDVADKLKSAAGDSPFPIGLLYFDMTDDSGYFGWLFEPGKLPGELVRRDEIEVMPINDDVIRHVVEQVDRWYDSRASLITSRSA